MATTNSGTDNNKGGLGSTYGGTQSADAKVPDGYQKPKPGEEADSNAHTDFGSEYSDDSSYGNEEENPETAAGDAGSSESDARGSGVR